jgi:hypothetical protein
MIALLCFMLMLIMPEEMAAVFSPEPQSVRKPPRWKVAKEKREREKKIAQAFIGTYKRGDDEYLEFVFYGKKSDPKLKAKFIGKGKFDYTFESADLVFKNQNTVSFRIKGKLYVAERLDETVLLTLPHGTKRYCPKLSSEKK